MNAVFLFILIIIVASSSSAAIDPEVYMDASQLITSKGYLFEEHSVTTDDGYILTLHRIPGKLNYSNKATTDRPVVFIQHGLFCDSTIWLTNLPHQNLPFMLADKGADVWMGNSRGTHYSRRHHKLSPKTDEFWDFSWDELATSDLPAMLTYVRQNASTQAQQRFYYVGHSQGTMIGFAGFSRMAPELAKSLSRFYALAPIITVGHIESPVRYLAKYPEQLYNLLGKKDFLDDPHGIIKFLAKTLCAFPKSNVLCENILFVICGFDSANMNVSRVPVYITHAPSSSSVKNLVHFAQMVGSRRFQAYDYGSAAANMAHYNRTTPPPYKLGPGDYVGPPVVLFTGGADWLADPRDALALASQLMQRDPVKRPSPLLHDLVAIDEFDHLDFSWGITANRLVYDYIVNDIFSIIKTPIIITHNISVSNDYY